MEKLQRKVLLSKTSKNSHMFNLSETVIPRRLGGFPAPGVKTEAMFARGEAELRNFLSRSYAKCFATLDGFWAEAVRLLRRLREKCYELKPDLADLLDAEFTSLERLEKFRIGNKASRDSFEEVGTRAALTPGGRHARSKSRSRPTSRRSSTNSFSR